MTTVNDELVEQVSALIRTETLYLNNTELDNWINLFTDDGYYWMPLDEEQTDPEQHDSLIYDNRALMQMRKFNLGNVLSPSMQLPVRSVRILSDLQINQDENSSTDIIVNTHVIAVIYHKHQTYYAGKVCYHLRKIDDELKIFTKRVDLLNADGPLDIITMYI